MKKCFDLIRIALCLLLVGYFLPVNSTFAISDVTGPAITDVRLEESEQTLTVGDTLHVSAIIQDQSAVTTAYAFFNWSIADGNHLYRSKGFYFALTYNAYTGRWEGVHTIASTDKNGDYALSEVCAYDQYNNIGRTSESVTYSIVSVQGAQSDAAEPTVTDVRVEESGQTLTVGDTLHVSAIIQDQSGVTTAYAFFHCMIANGNTLSTIEFYFALTYNASTGRWEGVHTIKPTDKDGEYRLVDICAYYRVDDSIGHMSEPTTRPYIVISTGTEPSDETEHISHSLTAHAKVDATCTKSGTEAYWSCNDCGKRFSDKDGKNEISSPVVIPVKGHTMVNGKCVVCGYTNADNTHEKKETENSDISSKVDPVAITDTRAIKYPLSGEWVYLGEGWCSYWLPNCTWAVGWNVIDDVPYYFNEKGWMVFGWQQIDGVWYYFNNDGSLAVDTTIDGAKLNSFGACIQNSPRVDAAPGADRWVEYSNGQKSFQFANGRWAYGWLFTEGPWYYFDTNGLMVTGWQLIDGTWLYFTEDGRFDPNETFRGWCFGTAGTDALTNVGVWNYGWQFADGLLYFLDANGMMVTGWQLIDGVWLYFTEDGVLDFNRSVEGWIQNEFEDFAQEIPVFDLALGAGSWFEYDDGRVAYQFVNGDWAHGMQFIDGSWYYFDANGWMVTGWQQVDGMWYYFNEYGILDFDASVSGWYRSVGA